MILSLYKLLQPLGVFDVALGLLQRGRTCREAAVHQRTFGMDLSRCSRELSAASRGVESPTLPQFPSWLDRTLVEHSAAALERRRPRVRAFEKPPGAPHPQSGSMAMYGRTRHTHYPEGMQTKRPLQGVVTKCQRIVAEGRDSAWPLGGQSSRRPTPRRRSGGSLSLRTGDSATPSTVKCRPGGGVSDDLAPGHSFTHMARDRALFADGVVPCSATPGLELRAPPRGSRAALGDGVAPTRRTGIPLPNDSAATFSSPSALSYGSGFDRTSPHAFHCRGPTRGDRRRRHCDVLLVPPAGVRATSRPCPRSTTRTPEAKRVPKSGAISQRVTCTVSERG